MEKTMMDAYSRWMISPGPAAAVVETWHTEISPTAAFEAGWNAALQSKERRRVANETKYGGGRIMECGHYVNAGEQCHICNP